MRELCGSCILPVFQGCLTHFQSKSLKSIVDSLFVSLMTVLNSMVLLGLISSIYASMVVNLFGEQEPMHFGKFSRSIFTMFQACTDDDWSTDITRPSFYQDGEVAPLPVFFVSYKVVCSLVLVNIIIAVLLDSFLTTITESQKSLHAEEEDESVQCFFLDPLMKVLSNFGSAGDLSDSVQVMF